MSDPLDNVNEVLEELRDAALHTTQGSFVRIEHVERLLGNRKEAAAEPKPRYRNFDQARRAIKADEEIMQHFPKGPREPGKSVPAQPQPPSRA